MLIAKNHSFEEFILKVKYSEKQIVCYGAGLVAKSIEDIFIEAGIFDNIYIFIDNDLKKTETFIRFDGKKIAIKSIEFLLNLDLSDKILLTTCEMFEQVVSYLNTYDELRFLECYNYADLNRCHINHMSYEINEITGKAIIPKTIHYCWFGGGGMSQLENDCIASWKKHNPNYEIVLWNEDSFDVYKNAYIKQAYQKGKFAHVSDFARLDVLYEYGGIYFDADVLVLKPMSTG